MSTENRYISIIVMPYAIKNASQENKLIIAIITIIREILLVKELRFYLMEMTYKMSALILINPMWNLDSKLLKTVKTFQAEGE